MRALVFFSIFASTLAYSATKDPVTAEDDSSLVENSNQCSYRNLYDDQDSILSQIPIYDQSGLGTCYAYSSAQLIDFYLKKNGDPLHGENISPVWIAFNHKMHENKLKHFLTQTKEDSLEYSSAKWAIKDLQKYGACKNEVINKSVLEFSKNKHLSQAEYFFLLTRIWEARKNVQNNDLNKIVDLLSNDPDVQDLLKKIVEKHRKDSETEVNAEDNILKRMVRNVQNKIEAHQKTGVLLDFLKQNLFKDCVDDAMVSISLPPIKDLGRYYASNVKISSRIKAILDDENPEPLAVGYCSNMYEVHVAPIKRRALFPRVLGIAAQKSCSPHYSLIVGKRPSPENNHCDYLVRNSYGTGFWTDKYECYCEDKDGTKRNCSSKKDKNNTELKVLGCWIDGNDLENVTFDLVHF